MTPRLYSQENTSPGCSEPSIHSAILASNLNRWNPSLLRAPSALLEVFFLTDIPEDRPKILDRR